MQCTQYLLLACFRKSRTDFFTSSLLELLSSLSLILLTMATVTLSLSSLGTKYFSTTSHFLTSSTITATLCHLNVRSKARSGGVRCTSFVEVRATVGYSFLSDSSLSRHFQKEDMHHHQLYRALATRSSKSDILAPLRTWVRVLYRACDRTWEEFVNTLPKVVGFLRFPPTGKVDRVGFRINSWENNEEICNIQLG